MRGFPAAVRKSPKAVLFAAVGLPLILGSRSLAQRTDRERSIADIVRASSPAVVLIETLDASANPVAQGSGFIISPDGRIATNYHVIEGADSATVRMSNGAFFIVDGVLAESAADDVAVVKVKGTGLPFLPLGDAKSVAVGQRVIAMGSPEGLQGTVSDGIRQRDKGR